MSGSESERRKEKEMERKQQLKSITAESLPHRAGGSPGHDWTFPETPPQNPEIGKDQLKEPSITSVYILRP